MVAPAPGAPSSWPEQAFVLSSEILDAVSWDEVNASYEDMLELGLAKPPYERLDIQVPEVKVIQLTDRDGGDAHPPADEGHMLIFRFNGPECRALIKGRRGWEDMEVVLPLCAQRIGAPIDLADFRQSVQKSGDWLMRLLVVLLATRNVEKERRECKTLRLGIGSRERNLYTTTLKIGAVTERGDGTGHGAGIGRRPHLRRGHIRRQHHGPRNELVKRIWIEPVFVNADEAWVGSRTAYNVSIGRAASASRQAAAVQAI